VRDRREFEAVNHVGTVNVLEAAVEAGAERVLHTSTESILTRSRASGVIDEQVRVSESDAVGPYCLSKLRAEEAAMAMARRGLPVALAGDDGKRQRKKAWRNSRNSGPARKSS
jgi:dihydroflavonol-4-reductase